MEGGRVESVVQNKSDDKRKGKKEVGNVATAGTTRKDDGEGSREHGEKVKGKGRGRKRSKESAHVQTHATTGRTDVATHPFEGGATTHGGR